MKLILIKLYKIVFFIFAKQNTATPQMFIIPEDGWLDGSMARALRHDTRLRDAFLQRKGAKARGSLKQTVTLTDMPLPPLLVRLRLA